MRYDSVAFILDLPKKMGEIIPEAKVWLTDEHITTKRVYKIAPKKKKVPLLDEKDWWEFRKSGLLSILHDMAVQLRKQLGVMTGQQLWDGRCAADDDTKDFTRTMNALLKLSTRDAMEAFCVTNLYTTSLIALRLPDVWDIPTKGLKPGYDGPLKGTIYADFTKAEIFSAWNPAGTWFILQGVNGAL
eukprot:gene24734-13486_t